MVAGIFVSAVLSRFVIWVAIQFSDVTSLIQKIEQRLGNTLGSSSAIFAHSHQCGPVPRPQERIKDKGGGLKLAVWRYKAVEVGQFFAETVTDALDAIERNAPHRSQAGKGGGFHIHQACSVGGGEAALLGRARYFGAGSKPEVAGSRVAAETLAGADVDDAGDVVGGARLHVGGEGAGPADGEDEVDGAAVFEGGEGTRGGLLAGSGAGGVPLLFFSALCPEADAIAGTVRPAAHEGFELARHGGDDGYSGHTIGLPPEPSARSLSNLSSVKTIPVKSGSKTATIERLCPRASNA